MLQYINKDFYFTWDGQHITILDPVEVAYMLEILQSIVQMQQG